MNQSIILKDRPVGAPTLNNFEIKEVDNPDISKGEVLLKLIYVSVDPYIRGRMNDTKSYVAPYKLGEPIVSGVIAEVVESKHTEFDKGDFVSARLPWTKYQVSNGEELQKVDKTIQPLSLYLGLLGMPGMTAYMGLTEIGKPKRGETIVVSGAAGAVGSAVGQIGKILGCRVVGIAGSDEKVEMLKSKFGFDEALNYNTTNNISEALSKLCPQGVDIYYDNVGGSISDAVHENINQFGRIVVCGAISLYNTTEIPTAPRVEGFLIKKSVLMQGFIVGNYANKFPEAMQQLFKWYKEGKLIYEETVVEGFESIPRAFLDLFEGKNKGKMIVKI